MNSESRFQDTPHYQEHDQEHGQLCDQHYVGQRSFQLSDWTLHFALLLALLLCLVHSKNVEAHDIDVTGVARVILDEHSNGGSDLSTTSYRLSVVDQQVPPLFNLQFSLPDHCTAEAPTRYSYRFFCASPLSIADRFTFPWRLQGVVVVANWQDGTEASGYFPGDGNFVEVPLGALKADGGSLSSLAQRYLILGGEHILFGIDHLLFVLALLMLIHGFVPLLKTITAFTIAHSITLALAVLGIFPVPGAPIEAIIALSILFLAREVVLALQTQLSSRDTLLNSSTGNSIEGSLPVTKNTERMSSVSNMKSAKSLAQSKPWLVAFAFGLIHGFGFAGALGELGLQQADIPAALLFFNIGVELGQVAFVMTVLLFAKIAQRFIAPQFVFIQRTLAYSLGAIAMVWFVERMPAVIGVVL